MGIIWGLPYLLIKVAVDDFTPAALMVARTGIGALILVPFAAFRGSLRPAIRHWRWIVIFTTVGVALPWVLLTDAERHISSSLAGLFVAAVPLIGVLLSRLTGVDNWHGITPSVGLVIGFIGVGALLGLDLTGSDPWAAVEMCLVILGYAAAPMIIARFLSGVPILGVTAVSLGLTALAYAPVGIAQMPARLAPGHALVAIAILAIVCTALAFVLYFALIAEVGPIRSNFIVYINTAVAVVLGMVALGEHLTAGIGVGFILLLVGLALATRARPEPRGRGEIVVLPKADGDKGEPPPLAD
jgi:drug/metabolite transporter (DMT)-like permease